jgi:L-fuconolactonase
MVIDSHQHFWNYDSVRDSWIDDSMSIIRKNFLPKDLEPILNENGVDGCIAVQADQSEIETQFLINCARSNSFIKGVVGWIDLTSDNIDNRLEHFSINPCFKGLRHIVQAEKKNYLLRKDVQHGISKLKKYNLTFDLLIYPHQIMNAVELVKKFPDQTFILDHIAKPNISKPISNEWKYGIKLLSENQNVSCKISGMVTETQNFKFNNNDFRPFLDIIFNCFGTERIMFGSDWPVCLVAASYNQTIKIIHNYLENCSKKIIDNIMGNNAIKIYNL